MRLTTFGGLSLLGDDGRPLAGRSSQRRRLAVLAYLVAAGKRGASRDRVLALLWPELDAPRARHALSQALYALRAPIGADAFVSGPDGIRIDERHLPSDLAEFEDALAAGHDEQAVALYAGPFLDGFFVDGSPDFELWAGAERRRLAQSCGDALERLAAAADAAGDARAAASWWRRRAELDPLDSAVAMRFMQALAAAGDPAGAIRHADTHAAALRDALDLDPPAEMLALVDRCRSAGEAGRPRAYDRIAPALAPALPSGHERSGPDRAAAGRFSSGTSNPLLRLATGALVVAAVALVVFRQAAPTTSASVALVVAAFEGPDSVLALAVREALRAELDADPGLRVLGEARTAELLRLMRQPERAALGEPLAIHLAQRAGTPLVVTGSVTPLGGGAVVVVRLLDANSGATVASLSEQPLRAADVPSAVGSLAAAMRARIAGVAAETTVPALPLVTTSVLPALRRYALARRALASLDRDRAIGLLRGALVHDSTFALAHYLLGDLLWYVDHQAESERHIRRAFELAASLPPRERLIVQARHAQLVLDRPDSARVFWVRLRAAYPEETLAHEGLVWTYLALGLPDSAAEAAALALRLDPAGAAPHIRNRMVGLVATDDTTEALAFVRSAGAPALATEIRITAALRRSDPHVALALIDSSRAASAHAPDWAWQRHAALLAAGRMGEAEAEMDAIVASDYRQAPPRALLLQARAEIEAAGSGTTGVDRVRSAVAWLEAADLSPPAVARLAERAAEAAAHVHETATIERIRRLLLDRDDGRGLRSYRLALRTIDAADAFARGDFALAAHHAQAARAGMFFARSLSTVALLEAEARAADGQHSAADSLFRAIAAGAIGDGDPETAAVVGAIAAGRAHDRAR